ncbi:inner membrane transporter RhmT [Klebsiella variicola subsp. variicola]|nr:inner membrane transporter RhmT [Klebsiella variicola subsp. variicola]
MRGGGWVIAVQPVFWTMPTQLLSGTALAAGIGLLTCLAPSAASGADRARAGRNFVRQQRRRTVNPAGVAIVGVVIIFSLSLTRAVPQRGSVQH